MTAETYPRTLFQSDLHGYQWEDGSELQLEQFKLRSESFSALLTAYDGAQNLLAHERVNLVAGRTRASFAKDLAGRWRAVAASEWDNRLLEVAFRSQQHWAEGGSRLVRIADVKLDRSKPSYLLPGLVINKGVEVIYGDGSAGKSLVVVAMLLSICTGHPFLGVLPTQTGPVIFFDWEDNEQTIRERIEALCADAGIPVPEDFHYREMDRPITANEERIRREVEQVGALCAAFDSMGEMLGGDPSAAEFVIPAVNVLKRTGVAAIGIHHLSAAAAASTELKDKMKGFGSMYVRTGARFQLLVDRFQEEDATVGYMYAFNTKINRGKRQPNRSWEINFDSDDMGYLTSVHYGVRDAGDYFSRLQENRPSEGLSLADALVRIFEQNDTHTFRADALTQRVNRMRTRDVAEQTVRNELNRNSRFASSREGRESFWGLASDRDEVEW